MTFGDILKEVVDKDLSNPEKKNKISYIEGVEDGKFKIKFTSATYPEATIECSLPGDGNEDQRNYLRTYFLSMVFNSAIHGMKRMNHKKHKK